MQRNFTSLAPRRLHELGTIANISKDLILPPTTEYRDRYNITNIVDFTAPSITTAFKTYEQFHLTPDTARSLYANLADPILIPYVLLDSGYSVYSDIHPKTYSLSNHFGLMCEIGAFSPCRANTPGMIAKVTGERLIVAQEMFIQALRLKFTDTTSASFMLRQVIFSYIYTMNRGAYELLKNDNKMYSHADFYDHTVPINVPPKFPLGGIFGSVYSQNPI